VIELLPEAHTPLYDMFKIFESDTVTVACPQAVTPNFGMEVSLIVGSPVTASLSPICTVACAQHTKKKNRMGRAKETSAKVGVSHSLLM
jgi:hypothetical protein